MALYRRGHYSAYSWTSVTQFHINRVFKYIHDYCTKSIQYLLQYLLPLGSNFVKYSHDLSQVKGGALCQNKIKFAGNYYGSRRLAISVPQLLWSCFNL